jgi:hypothetical protein
MAYMTSFERTARTEELLGGIELCLELKYGTDGLGLLPGIKEIGDIDVLRAVLQAIKTAASPEELRRVWAPPPTLKEECVPSLLAEPARVDEPCTAQDYAGVLSQVAADGKPVIVRRNGADLAAVIPVPYLELLREVAARPEIEELVEEVDWDRANPRP